VVRARFERWRSYLLMDKSCARPSHDIVLNTGAAAIQEPDRGVVEHLGAPPNWGLLPAW
jgi:hypothetical protein